MEKFFQCGWIETALPADQVDLVSLSVQGLPVHYNFPGIIFTLDSVSVF